MKIENKSPMRVDLAGGFLDIWPVHALIQDCFVVNFSIPLFTSSSIEIYSKDYADSKSPAKEINIEISSLSGIYKKSFVDWKSLLESPASELHLLQKHLEYWGTQQEQNLNNISICLKSESPIGAGLGGSSSLCVNLAKCFSSIFKKQMTKHQLLMLCRDIETSLLHAPAGIQDYIPALETEPNFIYIIECTPFGPQWKRKKVPISFFMDHLLLVDTGKSHHSGSNNWEILKKVIEKKDKSLLHGLNQLRDNALNIVDIYEEENWEDLFTYMNKEHDIRGECFPNWLNPFVSSIINLIKDSGAESVKLCGAGGGGCLLVLSRSRKIKENIKQVCQKNKIPIIMNW